MLDRRRGEEVQIAGTDHSLWSHRQAAGQLIEVFGEAKLQQQGVKFTQGAGRLQALGPAQHLFQGSVIGRDPGVAMGGVLFGFEQFGARLAGWRDARARSRPARHRP